MLSAEDPITQMVRTCRLAQPALNQPLNGSRYGAFCGCPVQITGIHHHPGLPGIRSLRIIPAISRMHHLHNGQVKLARKFPVALIMRRNRHNGPAAVTEQDKIGHPDGDVFTCGRITRIQTCEHTVLFTVQLAALHFRFFGRFAHIVRHPRLIQHALHQWMFRRDHHEGRPPQRVGPGGEHFQDILPPNNWEANARPLAAPDPVDLCSLYLGDEVGLVQPVDQPLSICCDPDHPLADAPPLGFSGAALTTPINHLLIGQPHLATGTPVNRHLLLLGQPVLEQLNKNPLGPTIEIRAGGVDLARPIKRQPQTIHLTAVVISVLTSDILGFSAGADGVILSGQAKRVPPDGKQDVKTLHAPVTRDYISAGKSERMPYMQPRSGWIGEFCQHITFGFIARLLSLICLFHDAPCHLTLINILSH